MVAGTRWEHDLIFYFAKKKLVIFYSYSSHVWYVDHKNNTRFTFVYIRNSFFLLFVNFILFAYTEAYTIVFVAFEMIKLIPFLFLGRIFFNGILIEHVLEIIQENKYIFFVLGLIWDEDCGSQFSGSIFNS